MRRTNEEKGTRLFHLIGKKITTNLLKITTIMNTKFFSVLLAVVLTAGYAQAQFRVGINTGFNATGMNGDAVPVLTKTK